MSNKNVSKVADQVNDVSIIERYCDNNIEI